LRYLNDVTFDKCFSAPGNTKKFARTTSKPCSVLDVSVDVEPDTSVSSKESSPEKDKSRQQRSV